MGESRSNRTFDDYMRIASELPPLKSLHHIVNQQLAKIAEAGAAPYEICRFRAGDKIIRYEPFPHVDFDTDDSHRTYRVGHAAAQVEAINLLKFISFITTAAGGGLNW